jgi:hypothetical protein
MAAHPASTRTADFGSFDIAAPQLITTTERALRARKTSAARASIVSVHRASSSGNHVELEPDANALTLGAITISRCAAWSQCRTVPIPGSFATKGLSGVSSHDT